MSGGNFSALGGSFQLTRNVSEGLTDTWVPGVTNTEMSSGHATPNCGQAFGLQEGMSSAPVSFSKIGGISPQGSCHMEPVTWRWGTRKKPAPAGDQHREGHCHLCTPPLSRSPDCGSLPVPSLKQRAPNHHPRLPVSSMCALIYIPMSTPPSLSCRRLRADSALCPPWPWPPSLSSFSPMSQA